MVSYRLLLIGLLKNPVKYDIKLFKYVLNTSYHLNKFSSLDNPFTK